MKIPQDFLKCVVFIAYKDASTGQYQPVGTAFFLGKENGEGGADQVFAVTARHVIIGLTNKGVQDIYLVANTKPGIVTNLTAGVTEKRSYIKTDLSQWYHHPTDDSIDVAVCEHGVPSSLDHLVIPFGLCVTPEVLSSNEVGLGDSVFITGLFTHHYGKDRNIPIVRTGNLAAFDETKVSTKGFGEIDAYLIEARSIGGLSGSPVSLNFGHTRAIGGQLLFMQGEQPLAYLLGLVHGHYDVDRASIDTGDTEDALSIEKINTGIAIVVPTYSIMKVIDGFLATHP